MQSNVCGVCGMHGHTSYSCWFNSALHKQMTGAGKGKSYTVYRNSLGFVKRIKKLEEKQIQQKKKIDQEFELMRSNFVDND